MNRTFHVHIQADGVDAIDHSETPASRVEAIIRVHLQHWLQSPRRSLRLELGDLVITVEPEDQQPSREGLEELPGSATEPPRALNGNEVTL